jgi:hypothetical protein
LRMFSLRHLLLERAFRFLSDVKEARATASLLPSLHEQVVTPPIAMTAGTGNKTTTGIAALLWKSFLVGYLVSQTLTVFMPASASARVV